MAKYYNEDVRSLLKDKTLIVLGDSIQRSVYKDLVCLVSQSDSRYLYDVELRAKGEHVFLGDKLLSGGKFLVKSSGKMPNGTGYREVRQFIQENTVFRYYFVTRCFNEHMESILNELKTLNPDVIIMNSCLWDIHHYGPKSLHQYNENLPKLLRAVLERLPSLSLFVWNGALPLGQKCKGGFLKPGFLSLPMEDIIAANMFAWRHISQTPKCVFLDLFSDLQKDLVNFTQAQDGIHWGMKAHRKISNLILEQIARAWEKEVPYPLAPQVEQSTNYPLPEYHPEENWEEPATQDDSNEALSYWYDLPNQYNSPTGPMYHYQGPHSGFSSSVETPFSHSFNNRRYSLINTYTPHIPPTSPSPMSDSFYPAQNYPAQNYPAQNYPAQNYWTTPSNPYTPQRHYSEPSNELAWYSDPNPSYRATNLPLAWSPNAFGNQSYGGASRQYEARYKGRMFNKKTLPVARPLKRKNLNGTPLAAGNEKKCRVDALFKSPTLKASPPASSNVSVSESSTYKPPTSDVNNNPSGKSTGEQSVKIDQFKAEGEPRISVVKAMENSEGAPSDPKAVETPATPDKSSPDKSSPESLTSPTQLSTPPAKKSTSESSKTLAALTPVAIAENVDREKSRKRKRSSDSEESHPLKVGRADEGMSPSHKNTGFVGFI